jgi:hypothetical protein
MEDEWDYPLYYCISGYVRSPIDRPLYAVAVDIDFAFQSYPPEGPLPPPYTEIIRVSPALTATLPGQINPFSYDLILGKTTAIIGEARPAAGSPKQPTGEIYRPLTVVGWGYADGTLSGTVRNDSDRPLSRARVVVADLTGCSWREAELAATTIQPNQEAAFHCAFSEAALEGDVRVVGQGAVVQ